MNLHRRCFLGHGAPLAGAMAARLEDHAGEEIARLERLVGRPNPF